MDYSFVIPSNRPYRAIESLLLSIRDQTQPAKEVIIIRDYASSLDEWTEYENNIRKIFDQTDTKVKAISIHNDSNFSVGNGASHVRNYGRKEVETPYMIFVDDDNTFEKDFVEKLALQRKKHPDAIIVPTQYQGQSDELRANVVAGGFSYRMCRPRRIQNSKFKIQNGRSLIPITLASSNCLSGPTKIFSQYPFDESIPFIYEDMIMTGQMSTHGVELLLDTDIPIYHHHGMRSRAANLYIDTPRKAYYKGKHRILLVHTLGNIRQKILFWTIGIRGHTTWLAVVIVFSCPIHIWWGCISGVIRGTRDGIQTFGNDFNRLTNREQLFIEINKFDNWTQSHFDISQDNIGREWELNYKNWNAIYEFFKSFVATADPKLLTDNQKNRLLYIIARDNETGYLANLLDDPFLIVLTERSIVNGHRDDKWQLAIQLYKLTDKQKALKLLENLVNDEDEYVNRRSLMELAKLKSEKVEFYAKKSWHKDKYGQMEEYQKIAVLHSLKSINSKLLDHYIKLAKLSGQKGLIENAEIIESEKINNNNN